MRLVRRRVSTSIFRVRLSEARGTRSADSSSLKRPLTLLMLNRPTSPFTSPRLREKVDEIRQSGSEAGYLKTLAAHEAEARRNVIALQEERTGWEARQQCWRERCSARRDNAPQVSSRGGLLLLWRARGGVQYGICVLFFRAGGSISEGWGFSWASWA
jgi:hypothetical protein